MSQITKRQLRTALNLETDSALAVFFGISPSAVSQWPLDEPIPMLRALQAEVKRPDVFATGSRPPSDQEEAA
jgi:DNA-binding transcriptional regulator YdaS (Cro superfamily)